MIIIAKRSYTTKLNNKLSRVQLHVTYLIKMN